MNGIPWTCCCRDRPQRFGWWRLLESEPSLMIHAGILTAVSGSASTITRSSCFWLLHGIGSTENRMRVCSICHKTKSYHSLPYVGLDLPGAIKCAYLTSPDGHCANIASLYHFRKNKQKMDEYIEKIKYADFKWSVQYSNYHYARESDRF